MDQLQDLTIIRQVTSLPTPLAIVDTHELSCEDDTVDPSGRHLSMQTPPIVVIFFETRDDAGSLPSVKEGLLQLLPPESGTVCR